MHTGLLQSCLALCDPVDCGLLGFSVGQVALQARILERIGQHWLPYLLKHFIFYYPSHQPPPEYLVLPEPLQPKQLHHHHTWPSQEQT